MSKGSSGDLTASTGEGSSGGVLDVRQAMARISNENGVSTKVSLAEFTAFEVALFNLFRATSRDDKEMVKFTIVYLFAVHGTGSDSAQYGRIPVKVPGSRARATLQDVVGLMNGKFIRHFMVYYHDMAVAAFGESADLRGKMEEKVVNANLSSSDAMLAIDFLDPNKLSSSEKVIRRRIKSALVARANVAKSGAKVEGVEAVKGTAGAARASDTVGGGAYSEWD